MKIDNIQLKIIPDSKGKETLEAKMQVGDISVTASVPAGESIGKNEVKTIPPRVALEKESWINQQIKDQDFATQDQFDGYLNNLEGANLTVALSTAFCKLMAKQNNMQTWQLISKISGNGPKLPLCFFNVIEGGVHGAGLPFQEHWFIPQTHSSRKSLEEVEDFLKILGEKLTGETGSEGGYTLASKDPEAGLRLMKEIAPDGVFGLDVAASQLPEKIPLSFYELLTKNYELLAIEDPYPEDDWDGFVDITEKLGSKVWIIADDLTTTNPKIIKMAAEKNAANTVIIKPTQIGTVTETIQAANLARSFGWKIIVANRGEETMDDFIADLAVGLGADAIKSGCPLQKERLVKYQRLIEIEKSWGANLRSPLGCLVLVRHTESTWNKVHAWTGLTDISLDEEGAEKAKKIGEVLKDYPFDIAFTSKLRRSQQTLEEIKKILGNIPTEEATSLNERDYGDLTGKNKLEMEEKYGEEQYLKWRRSWDYPVPNGESLKDVYERVVPYYKEKILPEIENGKNILIVAHGNSLRALVKFLENISDKEIAHLEIPIGEIIFYKIDENGKILNKQIKNTLAS